MLELLARHLQARLGISDLAEEEKKEPVIEEFTVSGIAKYIKSNNCKSFICLLNLNPLDYEALQCI